MGVVRVVVCGDGERNSVAGLGSFRWGLSQSVADLGRGSAGVLPLSEEHDHDGWIPLCY